MRFCDYQTCILLELERVRRTPPTLSDSIGCVIVLLKVQTEMFAKSAVH